MDGSLGSRTAYMAEPYADNAPADGAHGTPARADARPANWRGLLREVMAEEGRLQRLCDAVDAAGYDPALHAIGDMANHLVLDTYAHTIAANGPRAGRRLRIEHAQHLLPQDIQRFAALGVIASMQPLHKADDARYAEQAIGPARCRTSYAFRDLLAAGARVAFGSDWPVVSLDPLKGMHAAVTAQSLDGRVFVPEQSITIEQALAAYTTGAADAAGDRRLGRIAPGYLADFVLLDGALLTATARPWPHLAVKATYVAGKTVGG